MADEKNEISISGYVGLPEIAREMSGKDMAEVNFNLKEEVMSDLDYRLNDVPYDSGIEDPFIDPFDDDFAVSDEFLEFVVARLLEDLRAGKIEVEHISLDPYYEDGVLTGWDYDATINRSYEQLREEYAGQNQGRA